MSVEKFYLILSLFLFLLGFFGILIRKNLITILVSTELMLNGINLAFVSIDKMLGGTDGQVFALFILTVAAAEVAVGLGIIVSIFRLRGYEGSSETVHLRD
ncbi:MAG: NADH-quinone oxidoreductase subunit NuoK [Hydrogenobacter thermophilus]|uniref:NADH-quinone oxidoreductase subunit K n=1 Tax=Hydrogenobacter thermophilus (strain DSM 6534 / IAM 12695 / TK-6) TaxID=608538 RepID=D3DK82_HYDTT|nr:NADH-quinone oxidoreductase subunit NuoK [Hydrogenobacter thermophilus]ADO46153.1 NADH-ubiquinone oxidoreductase chain 4L [Hydrogenobacter thermophilus TK-6]MCS7284734.1 NADH-quinone oxidoreductase subunit NuoK [Hydrogenobacter thermophilus]QWK19286.1 MAG: NADH-quinone oxidoreductase subunit NuoK [Hydrogenobacter thermophilus]BAI70234.1 NADH dehydrogenase I chain K [Hydrogenobacter thermophilus TK-6]